MGINYLGEFNRKIDMFKDHAGYAALDEQRRLALRYHEGYGIEAIRAQDFMDRIAYMPEEYIRDWMDGKNELQWTPELENRMSALRGDYLHLFEKHPTAEIHRVGKGNVALYEWCGYQVAEDCGDTVLMIKEAIT